MPEFRRRGAEAGGGEANAPSRDAPTPPPGKRQSADPAATNCGPTSAAASAASDLLLELGAPRSVRLLVRNLQNASEQGAGSSRASLSLLREALRDLTQMRTSPRSFLFDRASPREALDDTGLFGNSAENRLFGREAETGALMEAKDRIAAWAASPANSTSSSDAED